MPYLTNPSETSDISLFYSIGSYLCVCRSYLPNSHEDGYIIHGSKNIYEHIINEHISFNHKIENTVLDELLNASITEGINKDGL